MTDWNWQGQEPFQPNIACASYLPPLEGCRWVLELVEKRFDPIVGNNNCYCHCEDNVLFEEVDDQADNLKRGTYCDHIGGWCANNIGPDNILGLLPFTTGKILQHCISNHVTQFSINITGVHTESSSVRSCKTCYILWGRPVLQCRVGGACRGKGPGQFQDFIKHRPSPKNRKGGIFLQRQNHNLCMLESDRLF